MSSIEEALSCFKSGLCCSQAILCAYGRWFGLDRDTAIRLSAGFGGGMGRMAGTCGAVTGAYMVLGLSTDARTASDPKSRAETYALVREFAKCFTARNGSTTCKALLGCDIGTAEGIATANEKGLFATVCPRMVRDAAGILEEMLHHCP